MADDMCWERDVDANVRRCNCHLGSDAVRRSEANLKRINELWELHRHRGPVASVSGQCLAFVMDGRYLESPAWIGVRVRLAVSFGHNPFTPGMKAVVPPPIVPGEFVLGLHSVAQRGHLLTVYDEWIAARPAGRCRSPVLARECATQFLASIDDSDYFEMASEFVEDARIAGRDHPRFWSLEIVQPGTI